MAEVNPFDQFDAGTPSATANPFDQFDSAPTEPKLQGYLSPDLSNDPRYQGSWKQNIRSDMWNGMPLDQAEEAYKQIGPIYEDPETGARTIVPAPTESYVRDLGAVVGRGVQILRNPGEERPPLQPLATNDKFQQVLGTAVNVGHEIMKTLGSAREVMTGEDAGVSEMDKYIPNYPNVGMAKAFQDVAPMIWGAQAGYKVTDLALKEVSDFGKLTSMSSEIMTKLFGYGTRVSTGAARVVGAEAMGSVAAPSDGGTLMFGEDSLLKSELPESALKWMTGIEKGDSKAAEIIASRVNYLADSVMTSMAGTGITDAAKFTTGFIAEAFWNRIAGIASKDAREELFVNRILDSVIAASDPNLSSAERSLLKRELITMIGDPANKELVLKMSQKGIKDIKITRDTMGALEHALANSGREDALQMLIRTRQLRQDVLAKGTDALETTLSRSDQAMDDLSKQVQEVFGGDEAIQEGFKGVQRSGQEQIKPFRDMEEGIQTRLDKESENLKRVIERDPTFGEKLNNLLNVTGERIGIDTKITKDSTKEEIRSQLEEGLNGLRTKSKELYDAIPDGVITDPELIDQILANENIDTAVFKKAKGILENSGGDYKVLHNELLPELRRVTELAYKRGDQETIDTAETLRDFVYDDALKFVIDGSDEAVQKAATDARNFYRDNLVPWKDGFLKDFYSSAIVKERFPYTAQQGMEKAVEKGLSEPVFAKQLTNTLSDEAISGNPDLVKNYVTQKAQESILDQVLSGKTVDQIDYNSILKSLDADGRILRENFPNELEKLQSFAKNIQTSNTNIQSLNKQLTAIRAEIKTQEEEILGKELAGFFSKEFGGFSELDSKNAYATFSRMMEAKTPGQQAAMQKMIERGRADPTINAALKVAYAKHLRDVTAMGQVGVTGASRVDINVLKDLFNKKDPLFAYGDEIFADEPIIPYTMRRLLGESHQQALSARAPSATGNLNVNPKDFATDARAVSDFLITQIWGPLSRAGARVRTGSSRIIATLDRTQQSGLILDRIYSDPEEFTRIAQRILDSDNLKSESGSLAGDLAKWWLKGQIYSTEDGPAFGEFNNALRDEFQKFIDEGGLIEPVDQRDNKELDRQTTNSILENFNGGPRPEEFVYPENPQKVGTTDKGRTAWSDGKGNVYSERTKTFNVDGRFVAFPTVGPLGKPIPDELLQKYLDANGPIDPITKEKFPTFATEEEANSWAANRSENIETKDRYETANILPLKKDKVTGDISLAVPQALQDTYSHIRGMMSPEVGDDGLITDAGIEQVIRGATELGLDVTGGSLTSHALKGTIKPTDTLSIFVGPNGRVNHVGLGKAMGMVDEGFNKKEIWDVTKWFKGADGRWRTEIKDYGLNGIKGGTPSGLPEGSYIDLEKGALKMGDKSYEITGHTFALGDLISHPELFKAYPDLMDYPVKIYENPRGGGYFRAGETPEIGIAFKKGDGVYNAESILHEVQHAVQEIEGFAKGSSTSQWEEYNDELTVKLLDLMSAKKKTEEFLKSNPGTEKIKENLIRIDEAIKRTNERMSAIGTNEEAYFKSAGEVEARNVEGRFRNRLTGYPMDTAPIPPEEQLFQYPGESQKTFKTYEELSK